MGKQLSQKKPASEEDWHRADVVAALHKAGWSLRRLSIAHGYSPAVLKQTLHRPYPKAEALIAHALGLAPQTIWPSRYAPDGRPNRRPGRPAKGAQPLNPADDSTRVADRGTTAPN